MFNDKLCVALNEEVILSYQGIPVIIDDNFPLDCGLIADNEWLNALRRLGESHNVKFNILKPKEVKTE